MKLAVLALRLPALQSCSIGLATQSLGAGGDGYLVWCGVLIA